VNMQKIKQKIIGVQFDQNGNIIVNNKKIKPITNIQHKTYQKYNWKNIITTTLSILQRYQQNGYKTIGFKISEFEQIINTKLPKKYSTLNSFKYSFNQKLQKYNWKIGFYTHNKIKHFVFYPIQPQPKYTYVFHENNKTIVV